MKTATGRLLGLLGVCAVLGGLAAGFVRGATTTAATRPRTPPYRYLIDAGPNVKLEAWLGWNLLDVGSKEEADALPKGTRGLVWVGDYDNSTCDWQVSDTQLQQELAHTAGDRKIAGFFFSDEPDPYACPDAPAQHRARSQLIHSLDPHAFTVMLLDSNSGKQTLDQMHLWAGVADRVALDPYPCYRGRPCKYGWIRSVIRAANRAKLTYWGVVQAFAGEDWRWPTPAEEKRMLALWGTSREKGYMTFSWTWDGHSLGNRPGLLAVLKRFNRGVLFRARR